MSTINDQATSAEICLTKGADCSNDQEEGSVMPAISIAPHDRLFVLTGAGISAESGLPTFRASDGLWAGHHLDDVCTPKAWKRNPALI